MDKDSKIVQNILEANDNNCLAIFAGAGVSKACETNTLELPTWQDIITDLKNELDVKDDLDYLRIGQLYYLEFGEHTYYRKLKSYFPTFIKPSELHKLIFDIGPNVIVTTNWDNILEATIEEYGFFYDVIRSDVDLTQSSLQNKMIKMHGDFISHNIVFKEDDYLSYQFQFPLLENYLKSILSTHTTLFMGYSYNDFNLKLILKWIQNHSKMQPPMYLTTFSNSPTMERYLANHGITILSLKKDHKAPRFKHKYSDRLFALLQRIKNHDEGSLVKDENRVVEFVLNKLKAFEPLEGLLLDQIQKALSNCGFVYDDDERPILKFYKNEITTDIDESKRRIYKKFVEYLTQVDNGRNPSSKCIRIFEILSKSDIKGIVILTQTSPPYAEEYLDITKFLKAEVDSSDVYLNFDYSNHD